MATFPSYPATTYEQAVDLTIFASNQVGGVVNGDALTEIETINGNIPSLRKALVDNFFFKDPIDWDQGTSETVFNQLRFFTNGVLSAYYYAPTATTSNPVPMGSSPSGDANWVLYAMQQEQVASNVYPWLYENAVGDETVISPPYIFDSAIVTINGIVQVLNKAYTISNSQIVLNEPLGTDPSTGEANTLFAYIGKVTASSDDYVQTAFLTSSAGADSVGVSQGGTVQDQIDALLTSVANKTNTSDLASTASGKGASLVGLSQGGNLQSAIIYITPFMFGGKGDATTDDTVAIRSAISTAKTLKYTLDLRGGSWLITGTLDFTGLRMVLCDADSKIWVDSTNFTSSYTAVYAITIGSPDDDYNTNRSSALSLVGTLNLGSLNRTNVLNGIFIKASLAHIDSIRVSGFNGEGVKLSATWDTKIGSVSCELCGNISSYQFSVISGGDTSNCLNIGRIQSEQAYHKCLYIAAIRSWFGPIHAERTAIISANDGTSGILSGLNYLNFYINIGNSVISQVIHDCLTSGTAPDGTTLAAIIPSVVLNIDFGECQAVGLSTSYVTSSFGRSSQYAQVRCVNWWHDTANFTDNTIISPYVTGIMYPAFKCTFIGGLMNVLTPAYYASQLSFNRVDFTAAYNFSNLILGNIVFNECQWPSTVTLGGTQAASGYSGQSMVSEVLNPTTFNNCYMPGTFTGGYQSHTKINGGFIGTATLASRAVVEFNGTQGTNFGHADTNNRGYITNNCKFTNVTGWGVPNAAYWTLGTETSRLGADTTSAGQRFWCASSTAFTWTKAY